MRAIRAILSSPAGLAGTIIVAAFFAIAALATLWTPYDPVQISLSDRFAAPHAGRLLGGDTFGRDVLSRLMAGAGTSASIALVSVALAALIGVPLGLVAGYRGGLIDRMLTSLNDALLAFPGILLAMALLAILGPSRWGVVIALGVAFSPTVARVVRATSKSVCARAFVEASRVMGNSGWTTLLRHVFPNVVAPLIVLCAAMLGWAILAESALAFLGLGVPPPTPTWGGMLADARPYMATAPWLIAAPGVCIALVLLGVNLLGDGLRDALDPRMSGVIG